MITPKAMAVTARVDDTPDAKKAPARGGGSPDGRNAATFRHEWRYARLVQASKRRGRQKAAPAPPSSPSLSPTPPHVSGTMQCAAWRGGQ